MIEEKDFFIRKIQENFKSFNEKLNSFSELETNNVHPLIYPIYVFENEWKETERKKNEKEA